MKNLNPGVWRRRREAGGNHTGVKHGVVRAVPVLLAGLFLIPAATGTTQDGRSGGGRIALTGPVVVGPVAPADTAGLSPAGPHRPWTGEPKEMPKALQMP